MTHSSQASYMCTIYALGTYRGHGDSALNLKRHLARPGDLKNLTPDMKNERAYRQAIDWVGNCFVQSSMGDVVAVATTVNKGTDPHKITFHISSNVGVKKFESKKDCWTSFLGVMDKIRNLNPSLNEDVTTASQLYLRHMVEKGWPRIQQKLNYIQRTVETAEAFKKTLHRLVELSLLTHVDIEEVYKKIANEENSKFIDRGIHLLDQEMTNLLQEVMKAKDKNKTVEERLELIIKAINSSKIILRVINSIVIRNDPGKVLIWNGNEDLVKLTVKLHNRLTRLIKFQSGSQVFFQYCLNTYKQLAGVDQISQLQFEVVWVEDWLASAGLPKASSQVTYNSTEYLEKLDGKINEIFKNDKRSLNDSTYKDLRETLMKEIQKKLSLGPSLHCEVALCHYLEARNLLPIYNFIGVTKLNCVSCDQYLTSYIQARKLPYVMTGTSGKWHYKWFVPIPPVIRDVNQGLQENINSDMTKAVRGVLKIADSELRKILTEEKQPRDSIGSDSSTGSTNLLFIEY